MDYIKTVKRFAAGSNKLFEIYKCTVDKVDDSVSATTGRKMIDITIGNKTYSGLKNKKVMEFLTENEGQESFVVLWKNPKGNPMVAYVWEIWQDYINGVNTEDVSEFETEAPDSGESFIYLWVDLATDRKYIGKHKGTLDDGYICSSEQMLIEYDQRPQDFVRTVLAWGSEERIYQLETQLLKLLGAAKGNMFFNKSDNLRG